MEKDATLCDWDRDRPILPWRLMAGAFLHFLVPIYLIAILIDLMLAGPGGGAEAVLRHVLKVSPMLLGGYVAVALVATLVTMLIDPLLRARRRRRQAADPNFVALRAERRVRRAVAFGTGKFGARAETALAQLAAASWAFHDVGQQRLARDLLEAVDTSANALATASPERRADLSAMAAITLERIAAAQLDFSVERARESERQAQIVAGYVEARYGGSNFSGSAD